MYSSDFEAFLSNSLFQIAQPFWPPKMSLYYNLNKDVDHMNFLMDKYGRAEGMARFRKCKIACGFREKISYVGAARITSWVKTKENAKDAKDAKDANDANDAKDAKGAKEDVCVRCEKTVDGVNSAGHCGVCAAIKSIENTVPFTFDNEW